MSDQQVLAALAQALAPYIGGQKSPGMPYAYKASGTPASDIYIYSEGGLFGRCDGPATLINAMVGPIGIESALNWYGTDTEREFVDALTAITESGSEQSTDCGNCVSISLSACAQIYCFGRFCRQSQEIQFDTVGLKANANIPVKAMFGNLTDAMGNVLIRQGEQITDAFMLQSRAVGYALHLKNSQLLWTGDPANSTGSYQEYKGFDVLINTGKYDAYTEQDCDALDSFLMNAANNPFGADGTYAVRTWFARVVQQFEHRANRAGLNWGTARMFIAMTPNQWECIARIYACAGLDLCTPSSSTKQIQVSADQAQARYEEYLTSKMLPIGGRQYPVITDSQISETHGQANGSCSDIYFITTHINGEEVTYGEYQDFNKTYGRVRQEMNSMFGSDDIAITDNGRYAVVRDNSRGCFDVQVYVKPRVVARMPWLLGRIQNVCCNVTQEPFPDTTGLSGAVYPKAGGRTTSPVPTLYGC